MLAAVERDCYPVAKGYLTVPLTSPPAPGERGLTTLVFDGSSHYQPCSVISIVPSARVSMPLNDTPWRLCTSSNWSENLLLRVPLGDGLIK